MSLKLLILLAAGAFLPMAPAASFTAQARPLRCPMAQVPYDPYQGPDGTYNSYADFSRDLWGVPCGVNCTREAQARWARYYHHCLG